jgi:hypothetical protein
MNVEKRKERFDSKDFFQAWAFSLRFLADFSLRPLYYCFANSLILAKQTLWGQRFSEIPPNPPFRKGGRRGDFWKARGSGQTLDFWLRLCRAETSVAKIDRISGLTEGRKFP